MARYSKEATKSIQEALQHGKNCSHPLDKRQKIGYGIYCDLCKCRVDFISNEEANKDMMEALKLMSGGGKTTK
jgi:hypothetical protein